MCAPGVSFLWNRERRYVLATGNVFACVYADYSIVCMHLACTLCYTITHSVFTRMLHEFHFCETGKETEHNGSLTDCVLSLIEDPCRLLRMCLHVWMEVVHLLNATENTCTIFVFLKAYFCSLNDLGSVLVIKGYANLLLHGQTVIWICFWMTVCRVEAICIKPYELQLSLWENILRHDCWLSAVAAAY